MDYLGVVETVSGEERFVVKAEMTPEVNDQVFDQKGTKLGTVKRIFGPVDGPYVTVVADSKSILTDIPGKKIYFRGEKGNGKGKRRH